MKNRKKEKIECEKERNRQTGKEIQRVKNSKKDANDRERDKQRH